MPCFDNGKGRNNFMVNYSMASIALVNTPLSHLCLCSVYSICKVIPSYLLLCALTLNQFDRRGRSSLPSIIQYTPTSLPSHWAVPTVPLPTRLPAPCLDFGSYHSLIHRLLHLAVPPPHLQLQSIQLVCLVERPTAAVALTARAPGNR